MKKLLRTAIKHRLLPVQKAMTRLVLKGHSYSFEELESTLMNRWTREGKPGGTLRGGLTDPFKQDPWIYACSKVLERNVGQVPFIHKRVSDGTDIRKSNDPKHKAVLRLFRDVNPLFTQSMLWKATALQTGLSGELIWVFDWGAGLGHAQGGLPQAIWPFPGDLFQPMVAGGKLVGWRFRHLRGVSEIPLRPEEVARFFEYNPASPEGVNGMPGYQAAMETLAAAFMAKLYEKYLISHYAVPTGALITDRDLTSDQMEQALDNWYEVHDGPETAGDIAILTAGMKFQQFAVSLKGLQADMIYKRDREESCAVTGIPPGCVGNNEYANYANLKEQIVLMWRQTIRPMLIYIQEVLATDFYPRFAPDLYGEFDLSVIPELQLSMSERQEMGLKYLKAGWSWEEIEDTFHLGTPVESMGEMATTRFVAPDMIPVDLAAKEIVEKKEKPTAEQALIVMPEREMITHARKPRKWTQKVPLAALKQLAEVQQAGKKMEQAVADEVKNWFWERRKAMLDKFFTIAPTIKEALTEDVLRKYALQSKLEDMADDAGIALTTQRLDPEIERLLDEILEDLAQSSGLFVEILAPAAKEALVYGAGMSTAELIALGAAVGPLDPTNQMAQAYLLGRRKVGEDIVTRFTLKVRKAMTKGFVEGKSLDSIANAIRKTGNTERTDAMLIARTEVRSAVSYGKFADMHEKGVQFKAWMHGYGVKTPRAHHQAAEGQVVRIDEPFIVGSVRCQYPRDWDAAGCEEWCNCGCEMYTPTTYQDGTDIPLSELFGEEPVAEPVAVTI